MNNQDPCLACGQPADYPGTNLCRPCGMAYRNDLHKAERMTQVTDTPMDLTQMLKSRVELRDMQEKARIDKERRIQQEREDLFSPLIKPLMDLLNDNSLKFRVHVPSHSRQPYHELTLKGEVAKTEAQIHLEFPGSIPTSHYQKQYISIRLYAEPKTIRVRVLKNMTELSNESMTVPTMLSKEGHTPIYGSIIDAVLKELVLYVHSGKEPTKD